MASQIQLRAARERDMELLRDLRNEPSVRKASLQTAVIPQAEHQRWYQKALASPKTAIYIVLGSNKSPIGFVRFQRESRWISDVSIALSKNSRGHGHGSAALKRATSKIFRRWPIKKVVARIKNSNSTSVAAFLKTGFHLVPRPKETKKNVLTLEKLREKRR